MTRRDFERRAREFLKRITIVSDEDAEDVDLVICAPATWPSQFTDDVIDVCRDCAQPIRHRPHAPTRPPKVCLACAGHRVRTQP